MKPGKHCVTNVLAQWVSFCVYNCNVYVNFVKQLWHINISRCAVITKMPISLIYCHICPLNGMYGGFLLLICKKSASNGTKFAFARIFLCLTYF